MMAFAFLSQRFYMVLVELPDSHDRCLNSLATFATWEHFAAILSAGAMFLSWGCARNVPPHRWHLWTPDVVPGVDTCRPPAASAHLQAAVDITVDDCQHFLCKLSWRAFTLKLGGQIQEEPQSHLIVFDVERVMVSGKDLAQRCRETQSYSMKLTLAWIIVGTLDFFLPGAAS